MYNLEHYSQTNKSKNLLKLKVKLLTKKVSQNKYKIELLQVNNPKK